MSLLFWTILGGFGGIILLYILALYPDFHATTLNKE